MRRGNGNEPPRWFVFVGLLGVRGGGLERRACAWLCSFRILPLSGAVRVVRVSPCVPTRTPGAAAPSLRVVWAQSLEIAAALAFAINRTLVFPPQWNMYLRGKSGLQDYFQLEDLVKGLPVIMYEDFHALMQWKRPGDKPKVRRAVLPGALGEGNERECPRAWKMRWETRMGGPQGQAGWVQDGAVMK